MVRRPSSRGFVLPLVAILLFALILLFTTLLKSAGRLNPVLARYKSDFETFYKAESAVLLHLQGFPSDYYQDLPRVQAEPFGPWEKICTVGDVETPSAPLCVVAGTEPQNVSFWDWNNGASSYRDDLEKRIQESAAEKSLYGNRRYFQGETFGDELFRYGAVRKLLGRWYDAYSRPGPFRYAPSLYFGRCGFSGGGFCRVPGTCFPWDLPCRGRCPF